MRHTVAATALGQVLAALIAGTAVSSTSLARQGVSAPTLQSALNYLFLGVIYTIARLRTSGWNLKCRWWAYAVLAVLDVEANFCVVMAYRYTSLTSVTLLDCATIPLVVGLSTALLGAAYRRGHYAGAFICIAGLVLLVATDHAGSGAAGGDGGGGEVASNALLGDGLVLLGACLYSLCNVLQEWLLGDVPVCELLSMLGVFGFLWSAAQGLPLELHTLRAAEWTPSVLLPFLGFAACMFAFYSLVPLELVWGGAALLNISLLASDLWAALARFFFFGGFQGNSLLFFALSLLVVAVGIALFAWSGDVDTQLGAGSTLARSGANSGDGLPVLYQRVSSSGGERLPLPSLSCGGGGGGGGGGGKGAGPQALEELQRLQQQGTAAAAAAGGAAGEAGLGQGQQQQGQGQQRNPFDIAAGLRGAGGAGGFLPLAPADGGAAAPTQGSLPVAVPTTGAASSPRGSEEGMRGCSLEMETGRH